MPRDQPAAIYWMHGSRGNQRRQTVTFFSFSGVRLGGDDNHQHLWNGQRCPSQPCCYTWRVYLQICINSGEYMRIRQARLVTNFVDWLITLHIVDSSGLLSRTDAWKLLRLWTAPCTVHYQWHWLLLNAALNRHYQSIRPWVCHHINPHDGLLRRCWPTQCEPPRWDLLQAATTLSLIDCLAESVSLRFGFTVTCISLVAVRCTFEQLLNEQNLFFRDLFLELRWIQHAPSDLHFTMEFGVTIGSTG